MDYTFCRIAKHVNRVSFHVINDYHFGGMKMIQDNDDYDDDFDDDHYYHSTGVADNDDNNADSS